MLNAFASSLGNWIGEQFSALEEKLKALMKEGGAPRRDRKGGLLRGKAKEMKDVREDVYAISDHFETNLAHLDAVAVLFSEQASALALYSDGCQLLFTLLSDYDSKTLKMEHAETHD